MDRNGHEIFILDRNGQGTKWSWTEVDDHFGPRTEMVMDRSGHGPKWVASLMRTEVTVLPKICSYYLAPAGQGIGAVN